MKDVVLLKGVRAIPKNRMPAGSLKMLCKRMKKSPQPRYPDQKDLIEFRDEGKAFQLHPDAVAAWKKMKEAAGADGIRLYVVSAFRSFKRQSEIIEEKRLEGASEEDIFKVNASPGFSEHHTGKAVDINTTGFPPLEEEFENSDAFQWLLLNAGDFGFRLSYPRRNKFGMVYETWHWFYDETA